MDGWQLVEEARGGNREALAQLLYDNYEMVFKYLVKFTFDRSAAEDLSQETMIKAIEKIKMYDPEKAKFSTWLIAIAQNIFIDKMRKRTRERKYVNEEFNPELLVEQGIERDDSMDSVLAALGKLDENVRIPIVLKHYHGYSLEEIARIMKIPLGTVKSRIHYGIETLRRELKE